MKKLLILFLLLYFSRFIIEYPYLIGVAFFAYIIWDKCFYDPYSDDVPNEVIFELQEFLTLKNKKGKWQESLIHKMHFPKAVSSALKGKKHEWYIVGFAKGNIVKCIYAHKGEDNSSVLTLPDEVISRVVSKKYFDTVFILHNHPNGVISASNQDVKTARSTHRYFKNNIEHKVKLKEFVCAKGNFRKYY